MTIHRYYPEMKEAKPKAQIEASMAYTGRHYFLYTPIEIKGRGVTHIQTYKASDLTQHGAYKIGWNVYQVTRKAFDVIKAQYEISFECLLD